MKNNLFLVISLVILSLAAATITEEEGVLVLNDANFDEALKAHPQILVEFMAPWCGHCQDLAPHYSKAAITLRKETTPIFLAKVDASVATELAKKNNIEGFPTIKFFNNGEAEEYGGGNTEDEIVQWMRRKTGPLSKVLSNVAEVTAFAAGSDISVVFFGTNASLHTVFLELAKAYDDIQFGECISEECLTNYKLTNGNVLVFRKFDSNNAELKTEYSAEDLKFFIDGSSVKLVSPFDEKTAQLIFGKQVPGLFFYRTRGTDSEKTLDDLANGMAIELKGKIQIIVTDITDGVEERLGEYIGITKADLPTIRIADTREELKKFIMEGEITRENILTFVKDWEAGKLVSKIKSEEETLTTEGKSPITQLVGTNFLKYTNDKTKDVLVEFYAPWCGHCQKLLPILEELATKLKETNPNVLITKIDATLNDAEGMDVQGFPTIKLFKASDKDTPVDFDGERDLSGLVDFLEKEVKGFKRPEGVAKSVPKAAGADDEGEDKDGDEDMSQNEPLKNKTASEEL
jgi:protein disulfide-isomerase A1